MTGGTAASASEADRPFARALERLRAAGLRPTRQRLSLARLLFEGGDRHVSAEGLHAEAQAAGVRVSLATIYNTLHQFCAVGLLSPVVVDVSRTYFDTNVSDHHHFYFEEDGRLVDIPGASIVVNGLPAVPDGLEARRLDITVRLKRKA